jgi:hypothetical protein
MPEPKLPLIIFHLSRGKRRYLLGRVAQDQAVPLFYCHFPTLLPFGNCSCHRFTPYVINGSRHKPQILRVACSSAMVSRIFNYACQLTVARQ